MLEAVTKDLVFTISLKQHPIFSYPQAGPADYPISDCFRPASGCRVGLAPTGKCRLITAHTHWTSALEDLTSHDPPTSAYSENTSILTGRRPPRRGNGGRVGVIHGGWLAAYAQRNRNFLLGPAFSIYGSACALVARPQKRMSWSPSRPLEQRRRRSALSLLQVSSIGSLTTLVPHRREVSA